MNATSTPIGITSLVLPNSLASLEARPDQRELWIRHPGPMHFTTAAADVMIQHHQHGRRHDVLTSDLSTWAFGSGDGRHMQLIAVPFRGRETSPPLALREHAFKQLCEKIGAPSAYLREVPAKLQIANVNFGMSKKTSPAMLRIAGDEIRAVLSDRYTPTDDATLFEIVDEVLGTAGLRNEAMVRASSVGLSTVMRLTLPGEGVVVKQGDIIEYGLDLANSEVGIRSVQVTPITYRLVCTNGMRAWQTDATSRFRHIGDPARVRDLLREAIPLAIAQARGDIDRWKVSVSRMIDDAFAEVESLRAFGISGSDARAVATTIAIEAGRDVEPGADEREVADMIRGARSTVFDVANAITATAKGRGAAARLVLEESAHRYLSARTR